jgi:hypothetical protein
LVRREEAKRVRGLSTRTRSGRVKGFGKGWPWYGLSTRIRSGLQATVPTDIPRWPFHAHTEWTLDAHVVSPGLRSPIRSPCVPPWPPCAPARASQLGPRCNPPPPFHAPPTRRGFSTDRSLGTFCPRRGRRTPTWRAFQRWSESPLFGSSGFLPQVNPL